MVKVSKKYHVRKRGAGKGKVRRNPKKKIKIKKVIITWKEGLIQESNMYPMTFRSIRDANRQIRANALSAPRTGGYDKHGFKIVWENGETYEGRMDVKYPGLPNNDLDMSHHIKEHLRWLTKTSSDNFWRTRITDKEREHAKKMLKMYELG